MTKLEIENMLLDIINNGAEYECRPIGKCSHCVKCRLCDWRDYKLGDKIHDNFEYSKKEKWCVIKIECCPDYIITLKNEYNKNETYFESYQKEECEKWIKEHTKKTWFDEIFPYDNSTNLKYRFGVRSVCKKILEEIDNLSSYDDPKHVKSVVESIIENLGIKFD